MPYKVKKLPGGKVRVSGPSGVHAKSTTPAKAAAQLRLLHGIDHGMKPNKARHGSGYFTDEDLKRGYKDCE